MSTLGIRVGGGILGWRLGWVLERSCYRSFERFTLGLTSQHKMAGEARSGCQEIKSLHLIPSLRHKPSANLNQFQTTMVESTRRRAEKPPLPRHLTRRRKYQCHPGAAMCRLPAPYPLPLHTVRQQIIRPWHEHDRPGSLNYYGAAPLVNITFGEW